MGLQTRLNRFLTCLSPDLPLRGYLKPMLNMKRKWLATEVSLWEVNKPTTRNASLVFRVVRRERLCTCWKARQKETSASRVWYTPVTPTTITTTVLSTVNFAFLSYSTEIILLFWVRITAICREYFKSLVICLWMTFLAMTRPSGKEFLQ